MHQNTPFSAQKSTKFLGRAHSSYSGEEDTTPHILLLGASTIALSGAISPIRPGGSRILDWGPVGAIISNGGHIPGTL